MNMQIQYGNMNPLQGVPEAVGTGLGLGLQYRKIKQTEQQEPNITIPEPLPRQEADLKGLLSQEMKEISKWKEYQQKASGLSEPEQQSLWESMKVGGVFESPIVVNSIGVKNINPKEYEEVIKKVVSKDPTAEFDLMILKSKLGKNSMGAKAIDGKIAQAKQQQGLLDEQYDNSLKNTLSFVLDFQNDPRKYASKGVSGEQVLNAVNSSPDYLKELMRDPETYKKNEQWIKDYLSAKDAIIKKSGSAKGYQPAYDEYGRSMTFNKDTGKYTYDIDPQTGQPYVMTVPESQAGLMSKLIAGGKEAVKPTPPPRDAKGKPQPVNPVSKDKYEVNKVYEDANGKKAKYLGNGKWQPL